MYVEATPSTSRYDSAVQASANNMRATSTDS
jgi:hypothetical protein